MDWRLISEATPTDAFTGRLWIKPTIWMSYIRLGSSWIPLAGSAAAPIVFQNVTILINGIDRTLLWEKNSMTIDDVLTQQVDTCSFAILTDSSFKPLVGMEILIFYRETPTATPMIRFSGKIVEAPQDQIGSGGWYRYEITALDYSQDLNRQQVVESYMGWDAGDIVRDIVDRYATGLGTYYVQDGINVGYISFNYKFPIECIQELAELTGYDWYVDYERNIHFFSQETNIAPQVINEAGTFYKNLVIEVDKSQLRNLQVVRGGYEFSDLYTQEDVADGIQESFTMRYVPYAPISVYVDTGAGYVAKTLGIDNIDTGKDFVYNANEKVIKNQDYAILTAGHKIKMTYKYKKPILALVEDETSITAMQEREGGDGIYEGQLIVDDTIETKAAARERAQAELDQYSNPLINGSFISNDYGFRSGQLLTINLPDRGENNTQYLIQEVNATSLGLGNFEYEITFATKLKGLIDFLINLFDRGVKIFERTDQELDRLKQVTAETITLADHDLAESRRDITASPYKWSNDGGTTPGKGQWSLAEWG